MRTRSHLPSCCNEVFLFPWEGLIDFDVHRAVRHTPTAGRKRKEAFFGTFSLVDRGTQIGRKETLQSQPGPLRPSCKKGNLTLVLQRLSRDPNKIIPIGISQHNHATIHAGTGHAGPVLGVTGGPAKRSRSFNSGVV
jgi:hypothetical protein